MRSDSNGSVVQCQHCGNIFRIKKKLPTDVMYIHHVCSDCGETTMLNCGNEIEDVYEFMNINIDKRYYSY